MRLHTDLTDKQMRMCDGLATPERTVLDKHRGELERRAAAELAARVESGQKTWGQVLLGSPIKPVLRNT